MELASMWKVPFREVYCESFADMVRSAVWCHITLRFKRALGMRI